MLKGADSLVARASSTRGFSRPTSITRGRRKAEARTVARCAYVTTERARCQTREDASRAANERYFGYEGTYFVWKVFWFQMLRSGDAGPDTKALPDLHESVRGSQRGFGRRFGARLSTQSIESRRFSFAMLFNVLYPTFLLRSRDVRYQRNFPFVADTGLDLVYASFPLCSSGRFHYRNRWVARTTPSSTRRLLPMLHTHFVISHWKRPPTSSVSAMSRPTSQSVDRIKSTGLVRAFLRRRSCLVLWVLGFCGANAELAEPTEARQHSVPASRVSHGMLRCP